MGWPPLGRMRGLRATASETGRFAVLALDHRQNLRRELRPDDPAGVSWTEMAEFKAAVVRALGDLATGVLLDPEIGVPACIPAGQLPPRAGLLVAVEATGYDGPPDARRSRLLDGWGPEAVRLVGADAAKLLLYYNPASPTAASQEALLAAVAADCAARDLALFLEPLTHSLDPAGAPLRDEDRRRAVVATARRLGTIGGDILKLEFPYDASVEDEARWADACAEVAEASPRPWVLLSGGVDDTTFERQVEVAGRAGASGVLVGRSVWGPAATLAPADRDAWLADEGRARLGRLVALVEAACRPWTEAPGALAVDGALGERWYLAG